MNYSWNEQDFLRDAEAHVPIPEEDKPVIRDAEELRALLQSRRAEAGPGEQPDFRYTKFRELDLSGWDLRDLDLRRATFEGCDLRGTDFSCSWMDHVAFYDNDLRGMKLRNCRARGCSYRFQDMEGIDFSGANIYASVLEDAINQDKVIIDDETKWYRMSCPETGPFVAWKCCTDLRVVMLLVPAEAKRCMATLESGRVSKAKVLSIKSIDETQSFTWAQSTVDPDFYYEVGKWLEPANGFQEDRWKDSSQGIHFFLERQQCVDYQSK
ncbi:MAG: pentapeptide repeat-containing protein [Mogibacterium sp.]|nr:pentapeptide repeat-containing protein [Mogibacterium sp.]